MIILNNTSAELPFECVWLECMRPRENFYKTLVQLYPIELGTNSADANGNFEGFLIVVVGKEISLKMIYS